MPARRCSPPCGTASTSSGPRLIVVSPTRLADEQRAAARAVRRRLGALEAALRAVDVTHCPPPRIEPRSPASTCSPTPRALRALGADDVDLARASPGGSARCRPPPARGAGSPPTSASSSRLARSGSGVELGLGGHVAGALVDRALERRRRRCVSKLPAATCALEALGPLRPEDVDPAVQHAAAARDRLLAVLDAARAGPTARRRRARAGRGACPRVPFRSGVRRCRSCSVAKGSTSA